MNEKDAVTSNHVRYLRKSYRMTQEELAERAGLAPRTIQSVERRGRCRQDTKRKIVAAFGFDFKNPSERGRVFPLPS